METKDYFKSQDLEDLKFMTLMDYYHNIFKTNAAVMQAIGTTTYNLETAKGYALDVLGGYVGINRTSYESASEPGKVVNDEEMLLLIRLKIVANSTDCTVDNIITQMNLVTGGFIIIDSGDMNYEVFGYYDANASDINLLETFYNKYSNVIPKPYTIGSIVSFGRPAKKFGFDGQFSDAVDTNFYRTNFIGE